MDAPMQVEMMEPATVKVPRLWPAVVKSDAFLIFFLARYMPTAIRMTL